MSANARYISAADTAKLVRAALKQNFPGVTFSVKSKTYSMGASVDVSWTDGPTEAEVKPVTGQFEGSTFDGMIDLKSYHDSTHPVTGESVHYAADSVHTTRRYSPEFLRQHCPTICERFGWPVPEIKVSAYDGSGSIVDVWESGFFAKWGDTLSTLLWREYKGISAFSSAPDTAPKAAGGAIAAEFIEGEGWRVTGSTYPHRDLFRALGFTSVKGADKKHAYWLLNAQLLPGEITALLDTVTSPALPSPKFRAMAETLQGQIDKKRAPHSWTPTARRARIEDGQERQARELEKLQSVLRTLASAWDDGTISPALRSVDTKAMIAFLLYRQAPPKADYTEFKAFLRAGLIDPVRYEAARTALHALIDPDLHKPSAADEIRRLERDLIGTKIPGFFPTPPDLAAQLVEEAQIHPGMTVLEPSAGSGALADAIRAACPEAQIDCFEINLTLRHILELKGYSLAGYDFMTEDHADRYDRIVMNPPFEGLADADHVMRAYDLLKPGGLLVSVMSASPFFRTDAKATGFMAWLESHTYSADRLPEGSFKTSGTGVNTYLVVIVKPLDLPPQAPPPEPEPEAAPAPIPAPDAALLSPLETIAELKRALELVVNCVNNAAATEKPIPHAGHWRLSDIPAYRAAVRILAQVEVKE